MVILLIRWLPEEADGSLFNVLFLKNASSRDKYGSALTLSLLIKNNLLCFDLKFV